MLSTWDSGSQLSELNEAIPGSVVETGVELTEWLARASVISEATGRAFDPTVGALIDTWDLRGHGLRILGYARGCFSRHSAS